MSSDNAASGPPGNRGRRRPGPTIELEATEVASNPQPGAAPSEDPATIQADAAATSAPPPDSKSRVSFLPPNLPWRAIGAGAAAIVLVLVAVLLAGRLTGPGDGGAGPGPNPLEARLERLERQLRELAGRTPPPAVDPKVVDDLASRVAKLEAAGAQARPPGADTNLFNRISTLEGALKALDEKLGIVARRTDDISVIARDAREKADATAAALADLARKVAQLGSGVPRSDLDAVVNRIGALERSAKSIEVELSKNGVTDAGDVRAAVTASALNAAVERGDAFAAELTAAKSFAKDASALAPLEPFASTGVPSAGTLGRELVALMPALTQAAGGAPREGSFLERLQANAERLVRIRRIDDAPGDDPTALLARIERRAAQADVPGALGELAKLSAPARAPAQAWIAKAQARTDAIAASRRFTADAFAALGKAP